MKKLLFSSIVLFGSPFFLTAQNVGVDVAVPTQKLDVAGAIRLGSTTTGGAGSLRWDGSNFQVHDGKKWVDFDLVAPYYGVTKPYKYQNSFPIIEKQLY